MLSAAGVASFSAVDVLFYQSVGVSVAFVGVLVAAFNFAVTAAELPFAILFDRYSNKLALQLGNFIRICAFVLFFFSVSEGGLLVAQILAGIAVAAMSGTSNALVINQIQSSKLNADSIANAFGKISYLSASAAIVGGLAGIFLFTKSPQAIWLLAIVFFIAAGIVAATFKDTRAEITQEPLPQFLKKAVKTLNSRTAVSLILANAAAVAPFILWQIKFNQVSILFLAIGYLGLNLAGLLGPSVMRWLNIRVKHIIWVALINVVPVLIFAAATDPTAIWISFVTHVACQGILQILVSARYHEGVSSSMRATAGSAVSLVDSLVVAVTAPIVTVATQQLGLVFGAAVSALLYLAVAAVSIGISKQRG